MRWEIETATVIGGRREQQDRVAAITSDDGLTRLVVLADGMGGLEHGATAAQTVIDVARQEFELHDRGAPGLLLERICHQAHRRIGIDARRQGTLSGSTCVALYLSGDEAYWIHVGDSRLYHFRGRETNFHTRDHSLGGLTSATAQPGADQLYACLGGEMRLVTETGATALDGDDWFLLCSDGFWSQVDGDEAGARIAENRSGGIAGELASLAAERGGAGGDNVTLAVVRPLRNARRWLRAVGRVLSPGAA